MKIRRKKTFKSNEIFVLSLKQIQVIPVWKGEKKKQYFAKEYLFKWKYDFFDVSGQKTGTTCPTILKLST